MTTHRRHVYSKLWSHYGPFGRQDVHFHPCVEGDGGCARVLEADGRECDGNLDNHRRVNLDLAATIAKREVAVLEAKTRGEEFHKALTIRAAVALAIEGLPGTPAFNARPPNRTTLRAHVVAWVHDYAKRRNVILSDDDITSELEAIVHDLRAQR